MPVYEIGETNEVDQHYLKQEFLSTGYHAQAAVAGEVSGVAIVNPFGSQRLITVEAIRVDCVVGSRVFLFQGPIGNLTSFTIVPAARDTRNSSNIGQPLNGMARLGDRHGVDISTAGAFFVNSSDFRTWELPYIIQPNWFLLAQGMTVNTALGLACWFQERDLMPEDLQG